MRPCDASGELMDFAEEPRISGDSPEEVANAWDAEIQRRMAQLDAGEVDTIPVEVLLTKLREELK